MISVSKLYIYFQFFVQLSTKVVVLDIIAGRAAASSP